MDANKILLAPVLTEKSNLLRENEEVKYVFKVAKSANKIQVIEAVEKLFSVKAKACNILNVHGKVKSNNFISKNSFRRGRGRTASWKKAIITLAAGQKIDIFEGA